MPIHFNVQSILLSITIILLFTCSHAAYAETQQHLIRSTPTPLSEPIKVTISISGIEGELKKNALAYLELKESLTDPHFSEAWLQKLHKKAKKNISDALQPFGYYQANISSSLTKGSDNYWQAKYTVIPGAAVKIMTLNIVISGPGENDPDILAIVADFPVKPADRLNHDHYETAKEALISKIERLGYSQIKIQKTKVIVDPDKGTAQIHIHLFSGDKYFLGELHFQQDFLDNNFILSYTQAIKQNDPFSQENLLALYDMLYSSGYFSSVDIKPDFSKVQEQHVPIYISLKPANRHKFTLSAGYDTEIEANMGFRWQHRRLNQQGHYSDILAKFADKQSTIGGAYWIPMGDPHTDKIGIIPKFETEDTDNTDRDTFDLESGYWFIWKHWETTLFSEYKHEQFTSGDQPKTTTELFSLGTRIERTHFAKALFPRSGWSLYGELRLANASIISDIDYLRIHLRSRLLFPLGNKGRLILRGEWGIAETSDFDLYPSSLRFYAGGDQSVRGYKWKALGPKDKEGDVIGGRNVLTASIEYNHQISEKWILAGFVDAGNAYNDQLNKLYYGTGFGIRWIAPFGLLRTDLGFPLTSDDDISEDKVVFYFGFEINI
ncbi:MAG: autotransporter assembly complex protein TamA [gamma proteobacterium symbiont of Bathyaustriella thionipta]|nr:autotransporter assembly complex protein TamA [gamma proteobacterium symbiont of Bathyaustriella thionipta]MCU7948655.1 autotransporter assembly complex protein TamA [gamma proteobacterium symbiont of Bathyaustriella thionipta]MCU7953707.1 autotransporter assembly complex protein TamA [gamma proteobacterium symbiont of Bathyaustriella thionipta]MCU7955186.1 autotransporter assembly complex protein TamA [gamma proteobacterium symbiont of Bathyaustriella thionipta]MCU7968413.1 autotransporter 